MQPPACHQALVRQGNLLRLEEVATESPRNGGLLVALEYVGVCGTDLQILNGTRPDTAAVLGHEGIGVVSLAGRGARIGVGQHVVFNPVAQIASGRLLGHNIQGLFQQYYTIDEEAVASGLVLPVEPCYPLICGSLAEPLGAVLYGYELISRVVPHLRTAAVFGAGPIGLLATRLLGALGARVLLVHTSQPRLQTAVELGLVSADRAVLVSEDLAERVLASNDGNRLDAALICTTRQGAPLALRQALELVTDGGCIDLVTNYPEEAPAPGGLVTEQLRHVRAANVCGVPAEGTYLQTNISQRRISLTGHRGTSADHLSQAMRELRSKGTTYAKLVTHVLSLGSAATAIATLANSGERTLEARDCIKAVIDLTLPHRHSTGDGGHGTMP